MNADGPALRWPWQSLAVLVALLALLTWLLAHSRSPDLALGPGVHAALQDYELRDAELSRDVLLARAGLLPNYDALAADRQALLAAHSGLEAAVAQGTPAARAALRAQLAGLAEAQRTKLTAVEHFKSNNALLRNSLLYFAYVGPSLQVPLHEQALAAELGRLSYAVLRFLQAPDPQIQQEILALLDRIDGMDRRLAELGTLVAHGRLVVRVLPQVDAQMRTLIEAPTGRRAEALRDAVLAWSAMIEARAQRYREALYLSSLLLLAYLAWQFARLRANARALRASEALARQQQRQLIEANKMGALGMHLEGVAHELRTPTQTLVQNASLLVRAWPDLQAALDERAATGGGLDVAGVPWRELRAGMQAVPADLEAQSRAIENLVGYLLDYGRAAHSDSPGSFDINAAVLRALRLMGHRIHSHTQRFDLQLAALLPPACGDAQRFGQVVVNLVNNALDALPDRQRAVSVRTSLEEHGACLLCEVVDEGSGIAPGAAPRLFEDFYTTRADRGGTGLGLGISRTIVRAFGGELWLEPAPGTGTRAIIRLPAWSPPATGAATT